MLLYNYKEIRTPIFEASEVFHRNQDDSSDMVNKETYDFLDRGNRKMTLRPEQTAPIARAYIENKIYGDNNQHKLFYIGPNFRYENPQKGRFRQFSQFGVEALNSGSPYLDADVLGNQTQGHQHRRKHYLHFLCSCDPDLSDRNSQRYSCWRKHL